MYACTLDTIAESAMNVKLNSQQGCSIEYTESVQRITALIAERVTNPLWHPNFIHRFTNNYRHQQQCLKVLHNVSSSIVEQKVAERQEKISDPETNEKSSNGKKKSLIEILLDLSDPVTGSLSMDNVKEQVDTFMFGGQDTVAISMSWTLILVGQHPDVQKKIVEELNEVFGDSDRLAENNDLAELKYLECVYKEALRLYPPIAFINRQISEDVIVGDYFVPAGTDLALHIHQLHRSPEHFANPNKFDPSHFFSENAKNRHPYAYVPFSAGPRNCIGQKFAMTEAKILLAQIFRHFEIETLYKMEDTVEILDLMLHPESRPHIKIKKRIS